MALGYLAGLVDGEGTIGFARNRPFMAVYNTSTSLMEWLQSTIGGNVGGHDKRGRVISYCWKVTSARNVYALCKTLESFLIIKGKRAREVMQYLEDRYGDKL